MPIDEAIAPYIDVQATLQPQDSAQQPQTALQPTDVLQALQTLADDRYSLLQQRIEAMERRQGDSLQWFMFGIVAGVLLVGVVAAIVLVGAWWR